MIPRLLILAVLLTPAAGRATAITIDGKYLDWANVTLFKDAQDNTLRNDLKDFAITSNLGADGKPDKTDTLYLRLDTFAYHGQDTLTITLTYSDGKTDTVNIQKKGTSLSGCNNCTKSTHSDSNGVDSWEIAISFGSLNASFAKDYKLSVVVANDDGGDHLPNNKSIAYNANTDVATSAQIVAQRADAIPGEGTMVRWQTGAELDNAGFRVWKTTGRGRVPVSGLVQAAGVGGRGAAYEVFDASGKPGDVYFIDDVNDRGVGTLHPSFLAGRSGPVLDATALLPSLLRSPPVLMQRPTARIPAAAPSAKAASYGAAVLSAASEGIYAIDPGELVAAGVDPRAIAGGRVSLARDGHWVDLVSSPLTGNRFLFYAQAPQNPYDGLDRYRVQPGPPVKTPVSRLAGPWGAPVPFFSSTVFTRELHEYDWYQPGVDPYAWVLIRPSARAVVPLRLPDPAPFARGSLSVHLTGGKPFDHAYDVVLNGTLLGTAVWSARDVSSARFELPAGILAPDGHDVLEVKAQDGVSPSDYVYLHDVSVTYDRAFVAAEDQLSFQALSGSTVVVSGFSRPDIVLLDVTEPASPRPLAVQPFADGTGHFGLAFRDTAGGNVHYQAATGAALHHAAIRPAQDRLLGVRPAADLLVVVSDALKPGVLAYASARSAQGLKVEVVTTTEVYDAYAGGDAGPAAVQALLRDALDHWPTAPRFLLLAGQGSMDPRGLLGGSDREEVPALFAVTRDYHLRAPSDVSYVLDGSTVRMAVGRIPARTEAELSGALAKILALDGTMPAGRSLVVTDGPENADAFRSAGSSMAMRIRGGAHVLDASLSANPALDVQAALPNADLVAFVGHAWTGGWGGGATLLDGPTAAAMAGGRTPFVFSSTCWESNFSDEFGQSVSGNLLLDPNGGSSGSFGPTTVLNLADHERLISEALTAAGSWPTVGEAVQHAQQTYLDLGSDRPDPVLTFVLLGDPTLRSPVGP